MRRPPRTTSATPFAAPVLVQSVVQGLGIAMMLLLGHGLLAGAGFDATQGRTAVFIALVAGVMLLILANRGRTRWRRPGNAPANPWLPRMAIGMTLILALVLGVPFLREVMRLAVPHATTAAAALAIAGAMVAWLALLRGLATRRA